MSYSRWSFSRWYTFDSVAGDDTLDGSVFEICGVARFTYRDLKDDLEACVRTASEEEDGATPEELEELRGYMREFYGGP